MRNILLSEYLAELSRHAARFCADGGAALDDHAAHWTAPLGGARASLRLGNGKDLLAMQPYVQATSSAAGAGHDVAVILSDASATVQRALSALVAMGEVQVWIADCPCGWCSGNGHSRGSPCGRCHGTGKRQEPTP